MSNTTTSNANVKNGFQIPKWAGKPPNGLHLDVMKEGKMIQKLMIDENKCYFFGRNKEQCEFVIDHASCSRVHAVLLWHKHLNRSFLIDLDSTHGTFIGSIRLDPNKPQQVFFDSELKFGASTRTYIVRERPQLNKHFPTALQSNSSSSNLNSSLNDSLKEDDSINMSNITALPESEAELDNLTEFNTAHNKRIAQLVDLNTNNKSLPSGSGLLGPVLVKKKKKIVSFNDEEDVINPEDVDPTVGRFRNMIQTTIVIPNKKKRMNPLQFQQQLNEIKKVKLIEEEEIVQKQVEEDEEEKEEDDQTLYDNDEFEPNYGSISTNLGFKILNLAPDVDNYTSSTVASEQLLHKYQQSEIQSFNKQQQLQYQEDEEPTTSDLSRKKIYAKESWPGHKKQQANAEAQQSSQIITTKPSPIQSASNTPNKTVKPAPAASSPPTTNPTNVVTKRLII